MIQIEEILNDYNTKGGSPIVEKTAVEKFVDWQKNNRKLYKDKFKVISVQKISNGIFVVYEK